MANLESTVYSLDGKKAGTISLSAGVFGVAWNADLVKQVADSLLSSARKTIAHTKNRGDVRGGGKKPWQQKGTGRARHGSTRSPIWKGGGVTHGPRNEKNYDRKVSKKMKAKALYTILSRKYKDQEVLFIDSAALSENKTKAAIMALRTLSTASGYERIFTKKKNATVIALAEKNKNLERAFSNLGNVEVVEARNLNPLTLLQYKYLIIENPDVALKVLPKISKAEAGSDKPKAVKAKGAKKLVAAK
jgi:large subunit ribosomal protein L4